MTRKMLNRAVVECLEDRALFSVLTVSTDGSNSTLTLQQAASLAQPGDTVQLLSGTYHQTLIPSASGVSGAPITFEAAPGANVTLSGADSIDPNSWTQVSGNIYSTHIDLGSSIDQQVFVDGHMLTLAQYPNIKPTPGQDPNLETRSRFANVTKVKTSGGVTTLNVSGFNGLGQDLTGAHILIVGGIRSTSSGGTVTAAGKGWVSYTGGTTFTQLIPRSGSRIIIFGAKSLLDNPGEFFYDPNTQQLYVEMPDGSNPAGHDVSVKMRHNAIDLSGRSFINVDNINLFAATAITDANSTRDVFDGVNAMYVDNFELLNPGQEYWANRDSSGIVLNGTNNAFINGSINFSAGNGVSLLGSNNLVENNTISNFDYIGSYDSSVEIFGSNQQVIHNTITNGGRDGINVVGDSNGNLLNSRISGNRISNWGTLTHDTGGIYILGLDATGTRIDHNLIEGNLSDNGSGFQGAGAYFDGSVTDLTFDHNVIYNGGNCAMLLNGNHNGAQGSVAGPGDLHGDQILNNTILNQGQHDGIRINMVKPGAIDATGMNIVNNILGPGLITTNAKYSVKPTILDNIKGKVKFVNANAGNFTPITPFNKGLYIADSMDVLNGTSIGAVETGVLPIFGTLPTPIADPFNP